MSGLVFGNAGEESTRHAGWFAGHFIDLPADLRSTNAVR